MALPTSRIKTLRFGLFSAAILFVVCTAPPVVFAADDTSNAPASSLSEKKQDVLSVSIDPADNDSGVSPPPPSLAELQSQFASGDDKEAKDNALGLQIRVQALREAALSYGARGGLAARTFEIQRRLAEYDVSMSKAFNFARLLIAVPSGLLLEPPVVSEAQKAVLVTTGGQTAAVADRIYRINRIARIVTAARDWHLYLERDWGRVEPPTPILLPKNEDEKGAWADTVRKGWDEGLRQAEEIFEADVDRMINDYTGMVRYRELLAQGMISPPYTLADDLGVTGGGNEMRVGDRGVTITGQSSLISKSSTWTTADH